MADSALEKAARALVLAQIGTDSYDDLEPEAQQRAQEHAAAVLRAGAGWQPIETAPKDGWFLVRWYRAGEGGHCAWTVNQARRQPEFAGRGYFETFEGGLFQGPTHWMPLPPPPTALGED